MNRRQFFKWLGMLGLAPWAVEPITVTAGYLTNISADAWENARVVTWTHEFEVQGPLYYKVSSGTTDESV